MAQSDVSNIIENKETKDRYIELYPSNWLYNAGVVGFLMILDNQGIDKHSFFVKDGTVKGSISENLFESNYKIANTNYGTNNLAINYLKKCFKHIIPNEIIDDEKKLLERVWGVLFNAIYRGLFNANSNYLFKPTSKGKATIEDFNKLINNFNVADENTNKCSFCGQRNKSEYKNNFSKEHFKELGASDGKKGTPNYFWNCSKDSSMTVCDTCTFLLIHKHFALTKLSDRTEIFINTPSFQTTYYLNDLAKHLLSVYDQSVVPKKQLLAMSLVEYIARISVLLGQWAAMNIELISLKNGEIEYYSLPNDVVQLISNRQVAAQIRDIGEFSILNMIINRDFGKLVNVAGKLLQESIKDKPDWKFIGSFLYLDNNKKNLQHTANKILKLYALIEDRVKLIKTR